MVKGLVIWFYLSEMISAGQGQLTHSLFLSHVLTRYVLFQHKLSSGDFLCSLPDKWKKQVWVCRAYIYVPDQYPSHSERMEGVGVRQCAEGLFWLGQLLQLFKVTSLPDFKLISFTICSLQPEPSLQKRWSNQATPIQSVLILASWWSIWNYQIITCPCSKPSNNCLLPPPSHSK